MHYFDYAASTPMFKEAIEVLSKSCENDFANIAAVHKMAKKLNEEVNDIRLEVLKLFGLSSRKYKVFFTSSATESNNIIIQNFKNSDKYCFCNPTDHSSILLPVKKIFEDKIIKFPMLEYGIPDYSAISNIDLQNCSLVVTSMVNGQNGALIDGEKLSTLLKSKNKITHIHYDLVQTIGKCDFDLSKIDFDSITISSHKLGGPKGIAALIIKNDLRLNPLMFGGGQEDGIRPSSVAVPLIKSFIYALKKAHLERNEHIEKMLNYKKRFLSELQNKFPDIIVISPESSIGNIISLIVPKIFGDVIVRNLEIKDIIISTSAACSSKKKFDDYLLEFIIPAEYHKNLLRISMGHLTSDNDIAQLTRGLLDVLNLLYSIKR